MKTRFAPVGIGACLGGALLASAPGAWAQAETGNVARMDRLEKENQELRKRLETIEGMAKREGLIPSGPTNVLKALSDITLSGFVSASYFYDGSVPGDNSPNGYLWNRNHNSFAINKVKLTLASAPVERSGEKWGAGFRASLIFGEDAPIVNTGGERQGLEDLREAFVELNVPIGTGLNVKAGQLISLLNFESGDGGVANPNFSQGNQWFFTGNGPSTGVQLGYALNDMISLTARIQNGLYAGAVDGNGYKTFMGSVGVKLDDKTSLSFIGFGGREGSSSSQWLKGGSFIGSRSITDKLNVATEIDYFNADTATGDADAWSLGAWVWMDFTSTLGLALRGDYINDNDAVVTTAPPGGLLGFPFPHSGMELYSATLTLNWKPAPNIKIQPEIRWDHTSLAGGFDGQDSRIVVGAGVSYLF